LEVVRFAAIAEEDESYDIQTVFGTKLFTRRAGEVLHPAREPIETIERIRSTLGEYNFAGQYQQSPAPLGGGMVKREWFKTYSQSEGRGFNRIVQSWDTANKANELADYSVCTTWGIKDKHVYLIDVLRKRLEYPDLKRAVREQHRLHNASVVLIEDKASGTQLIQELAFEGLHAAKRYEPEMDKIMRLHAQTGAIENGFVHLPESAHWLAAYVHELITFPYSNHDDQADSTSQFLDWFKQSGLVRPARSVYINWMER
jgi:predicted phage terminase large subunit-like protein